MTKTVAGMMMLLAVPAGIAVARQQGTPQAPTFRTATDIVVIETQVVARDGAPVQGLKPDQFEVFIDGRRRPLVSAEFLRATGPSPAVAGGPPAAPGAAAPRDGRIIVIGVDEASFPVSGQAAAREAATRIVDRAAADDHVGMIAFPGRIEISPTRERRVVREGITRITGARVDVKPRHNISAMEATLLMSHDMATNDIIKRECLSVSPRGQDPACPEEVMQDGQSISTALEQQGLLSLSGLHGALDAIASLPGRKTFIVISAGLPMSNRPGGRPNFDDETTRLARHAAASNVNLYVFYMNVHFIRFYSPAYGKQNYTIFEDVTLFGYGLEKFADSGGGAFYQIDVDPNPFVDRVLRETSASYLLAVRVEPADRDGKEHFIRVSVKQGGATVRYRKVVTIPRGGG
jgi:VWFA-related protein